MCKNEGYPCELTSVEAHLDSRLKAWASILGSVAAGSLKVVGCMGALVQMHCNQNCSVVNKS